MMFQSEKKEDALMLEVEMTESAFGHEYALANLQGAESYSQKQAVMWQLEALKQRYFEAREILERLNPQKLELVEEGLRLQKMVLGFDESLTVH